MLLRLLENSFSTRIFYLCPQVKLSPRFISSPPLFPHTNLVPPLAEKEEETMLDLSKVLRTRVFAAFSNYKNFNTVLCLDGFQPQFALNLLIQGFPQVLRTWGGGGALQNLMGGGGLSQYLWGALGGLKMLSKIPLKEFI